MELRRARPEEFLILNINNNIIITIIMFTAPSSELVCLQI